MARARIKFADVNQVRKSRFARWGLMVILGLGIVLLGIAALNYGLMRVNWWGVGPYRFALVKVDKNNKLNKVRIFEIVSEVRVIRAIDLPGDLLVEAWGYPGTYRLAAIYALSYKETGSAVLLQNSIQASLGLFINRFDKEGASSPDTVTTRELMSRITRAAIQAHIPLKEAMNLINLMQGMINQEIDDNQLKDIGAIKMVTEVDGLTYYSFDASGFDDWYHKSLPVVSQSLRTFTVSIENTTVTEGLGKQVARLLSHQGYDVIRVSDGLPGQKSQLIFLNQEKEKSAGGKLITGILHETPVAVADLSSYRSEVLVKLGDDFVKKTNDK